MRIRNISKVIAIGILTCCATGCVVLVPLVKYEPSKEHRADALLVQRYRPDKLHSFAPSIGEVKSMQLRRKITRLIKQLRNKDDVARTHAATDLGNMRAKARIAISALATVIKEDNSKWVRRAAARALGKIGSRQALPPLQTALRDRDKWVAHSAQKSLRRLGVKRGSRSRRSSTPIYRARGDTLEVLQ